MTTPAKLSYFTPPTKDEPGSLTWYDKYGAPLIAFNPDNGLLAAAFTDGKILLWDITTGQEVRSLRTSGAFSDLAFSPDGAWLAVVARGHLEICDVAAGTFQRLDTVPEPFSGSYEDVEFSPDGSWLAVGPITFPPDMTSDVPYVPGNVEIWETKTWTRQRVLPSTGVGFHFSPDGTKLASISDYFVSTTYYRPPVIWDVTTGARWNLDVTGFPVSLAYSPDGKTLAINADPMLAYEDRGEAGTLLVDTVSGQTQRFIPSPDGHRVGGVSFSVDGTLLATTYIDVHQIIFWDVESGNQAFALDIPGAGIAGAAFSPDGKLLAVVTHATDNRILFWILPQGD